jgi:hypothetical protein
MTEFASHCGREEACSSGENERSLAVTNCELLQKGEAIPATDGKHSPAVINRRTIATQ